VSTKTVEIPELLHGQITEDQAIDAFCWWAKLTGKESMDWTNPGVPVSIAPGDLSRMADAANGLMAVTRLLRMEKDASESRINSPIACGLVSAVVALADLLDRDLNQLVMGKNHG
jgi:hypothetical protein